MKYVFTTCALIATLFIFDSCKKKEAPLSDPHVLLLFPKKNEGRLSDEQLNNARMYFFQNGQKYVKDFGRADGKSFQKGILKSSDIATLSAVEKIKDYYLEFPDGSIDTLFVDYQQVAEEEGRKEPCFCDKPLKSIRVNYMTLMQQEVTYEGVPIFTYYKDWD